MRVKDAVGQTATRKLRLRLQLERARHALSDRHLRCLLPDRPAGVVGADAASTRLARLDPARELRLLRLVGLAFRLPARRLDGRQPRAGRRDPPGERCPRTQRRCFRSRWPSTSGCSATSSTRTSSSARSTTLIGTSWIAHVVLPVGISFFTFMAISYVVDTYRGQLVPASFARFAVFQAFFPHLVAGPIVRASELLPQLEQPARPAARRRLARIRPDRQRALPEGGDRESPRDAHRRRRVRRAEPALVARGARRASTATPSRSSPTSAATRTSRSASRCCSASSSRRTSHSPYTAVSLQDFWRRWHMTLSRWLRDYLYIPLGGNRKGAAAHLPQPDADDAARRALARRGVDVRRLGRDPRRRARGRARARLATDVARRRNGSDGSVTFHVVCFAWIFFRADSFGRAGAGDRAARSTRGGSSSPLVTTSVVLAIVVGIGAQFIRPAAVAAFVRRLRSPADRRRRR